MHCGEATNFSTTVQPQSRGFILCFPFSVWYVTARILCTIYFPIILASPELNPPNRLLFHQRLSFPAPNNERYSLHAPILDGLADETLDYDDNICYLGCARHSAAKHLVS